MARTSIALPESFLGEVELLEENLDAAERALEHALAMACRLGDLCFEALATRALSLLQVRRGEPDLAVSRLQQARANAFANPDYIWSTSYVLDALCQVASECAAEAAGHWIGELESLGGQTGMREFVAHAYLRRFPATRRYSPSWLTKARNSAQDSTWKDRRYLMRFVIVQPGRVRRRRGPAAVAGARACRETAARRRPAGTRRGRGGAGSRSPGCLLDCRVSAGDEGDHDAGQGHRHNRRRR